MSSPVVVGTPVSEPRTVYYDRYQTVRPDVIRVYSNRRPCYEEDYVVERYRPIYTDPYAGENDAALFICLYCWCLFIVFLLIVSYQRE